MPFFFLFFKPLELAFFPFSSYRMNFFCIKYCCPVLNERMDSIQLVQNAQGTLLHDHQIILNVHRERLDGQHKAEGSSGKEGVKEGNYKVYRGFSKIKPYHLF